MSGTMVEKPRHPGRIPPLIICPYCQPGMVSYAGVVLSRICAECKKALAEAEK